MDVVVCCCCVLGMRMRVTSGVDFVYSFRQIDDVRKRSIVPSLAYPLTAMFCFSFFFCIVHVLTLHTCGHTHRPYTERNESAYLQTIAPADYLCFGLCTLSFRFYFSDFGFYGIFVSSVLCLLSKSEYEEKKNKKNIRFSHFYFFHFPIGVPFKLKCSVLSVHIIRNINVIKQPQIIFIQIDTTLHSQRCDVPMIINRV